MFDFVSFRFPLLMFLSCISFLFSFFLKKPLYYFCEMQKHTFKDNQRKYFANQSYIMCINISDFYK